VKIGESIIVKENRWKQLQSWWWSVVSHRAYHL